MGVISNTSHRQCQVYNCSVVHNNPLSVWPHLFRGDDHEKKGGESS